ncbi:EcsC family protein [Negadavirga shengliensis]|uniref:EcsC family protein n=1 Tax=Negadavirga shengliensis TaxID=1389218 RepID=A0ABV9SVN0_9BACT
MKANPYLPAEELYERLALRDMQAWLAKTKKEPSIANRLTKGTQRAINKLIPEKIHQAITKAIEVMVKGVLTGNQYVTPKPNPEPSLRLKEYKARKIIRFYQRTASVEGAVTGAGGILMGIADFPAFLAIKMKMLFEVAAAYGFDVKDYRERVFLLMIFKLTFSSQKTRNQTILELETWDEGKLDLPENLDSFDWRSFQLEYRDYMDLAKLAQLLPIIGAGVGAVANYQLSKQLGKTAMNAYRLRYFSKKGLL